MKTDFAATKARFALPEGVIYLDGNSLGPLPRSVAARVQSTVENEWGEMLITAWNRAGWMDQPARVGDRIARLIGAEPGHVVVGDTLSLKVYQALAGALQLRPDRRVVLSDTGNFPSDLYMAQGLLSLLGDTYELRCVAPEAVAASITEEVAVVLLTEVDYRTGRLHDMEAVTRKAHAMGAVTVWDLAHSAGALPVDVAEAGADFAVGCTYKFINAGPGAPAFIYVAPRYADRIDPALAGWLGHAAPFAFDPGYRPGAGIARMRVGTPPVLQMAALEAALDIWDLVDLSDLRTRSIALSERFIAEVARTCPALRLASPSDPTRRGSQVSFHFDDGYAVMQALIARGVIGDFRSPDIMRFGITPLYSDAQDIDAAVALLADILDTGSWDQPDFKTRAAVT
ncbi:MAG: kynureninase [Pseudomonadota bacterium]